MTEYLTEEEQVEQLKKWVKEYAGTVILGIALAFAAVSAWHYYQNYRAKILYHASGVFDEMLTLRAQNDTDATMVQANKLLTHYKNTPYAQIAALMLARDEVLKKNYPEAIKQLDWVVANGKDANMREIARLREARILIAENKSQDAINLLTGISVKSYNGYADEIRGDAYLAMNKASEAKKFYQLALQEIPNADETRPILQMKFDNLAASTDAQ